MKVIEKTVVVRYFVDGDFEWELNDFYDTVEMLNSQSYIKVTSWDLEDYLIEKGLITKYMQHNETTDKFEEFFNKVTELAYGGE